MPLLRAARCVRLLGVLLLLLLLAVEVKGRVFLGVSRVGLHEHRDFDFVGRFCFVIPKGQRGTLSSDVVIRDAGHKLVLTRTRDSENIFGRQLLQFSKHGTAGVTITKSMMNKQIRAIRDYQHKLDAGQFRRSLLSSLETDSLLHELANPSHPSSSSSSVTSDDSDDGESFLEGTITEDQLVILRGSATSPPAGDVHDHHHHGGHHHHGSHHHQQQQHSDAESEGAGTSRQALVGEVHLETAPEEERGGNNADHIVGVHKAGSTVSIPPHAGSRSSRRSRHDDDYDVGEMLQSGAQLPRNGHADDGPPPPVIVRADVDSGPNGASSTCEALESKSRVSENLMPVAERSAYKLVLWVESHVSGESVDLWITRCGGEPHAEYQVLTMNPGPIWVRHFGCEEQGVLQTLSIVLIVYLLMIPLGNRLFHGCQGSRREHPVVDCFFLACAAEGCHQLFHGLHVFAFAIDGQGVRGFSFLGDMAHAAFIASVTFVIVRIVVGKRLGNKHLVRGGNDGEPCKETERLRGEDSPAHREAPWWIPLTPHRDFLQTAATVTASFRRLTMRLLRLGISWNGLWLGMSGTAAVAMWLQGLRGLTSPDALVVPDFEFLHPSVGYRRGALMWMLALLVKLHWGLRVTLGFLCLRVVLLRRDAIPRCRAVAAVVGTIWCVLIPMNTLMFRHYHHLYQFVVPLTVAGSNVGLLIGLGFVLGSNRKYCVELDWPILSAHLSLRSANPLFSAPKFSSAIGGRWEDLTTDETEPEPQLIDLARLPQPPGHSFAAVN